MREEIEAQSSAGDERTSSDLPATQRQRYTSAVSVPLNQWVTIVSSGKAARAGTYSSGGGSDGRRLV